MSSNGQSGSSPSLASGQGGRTSPPLVVNEEPDRPDGEQNRRTSIDIQESRFHASRERRRHLRNRSTQDDQPIKSSEKTNTATDKKPEVQNQSKQVQKVLEVQEDADDIAARLRRRLDLNKSCSNQSNDSNTNFELNQSAPRKSQGREPNVRPAVPRRPSLPKPLERKHFKPHNLELNLSKENSENSNSKNSKISSPVSSEGTGVNTFIQ